MAFRVYQRELYMQVGQLSDEEEEEGGSGSAEESSRKDRGQSRDLGHKALVLALLLTLLGLVALAAAAVLPLASVLPLATTSSWSGGPAEAAMAARVPKLRALQVQLTQNSSVNATSALEGAADVTDSEEGNVCAHNEELYFGLCYKKCGLLTGGSHPVRTTPWTCCAGHPCTFSNQKGSIGIKVLCNGYDVSGSGGCPHKPGRCKDYEELFLGFCYKRCDLLTNGSFPHRVAAATCCQGSGLGCLDLRKDRTSASFAEGAHPATEPAASPSGDSAKQRGGGIGGTATDDSVSLGALQPGEPLEPVERMNDGNLCDDREELYGGLCYKRCSLLTDGRHPIRTSSWTCCSSRPCGLTNEKGAIGRSILCNGFDVSAEGTCPHKPGACLADEEMLYGVCYMKCSILTKGLYPHRVAAATCCKGTGLSCMDIFIDKTSPQFNVGGGNSSSQLAKPHPPLTSLTESEETGSPVPPDGGDVRKA